MISTTTTAMALTEITEIARPATRAVSDAERVASVEMFLAVLEGDERNIQLAADTLAFHASPELIAAFRAANSRIADLIENSRCYIRIH